MVERDECAAGPRQRASDVARQHGLVRFDAPERIERDAAQGDDDRRPHELELRRQEVAAGGHFARARTAVVASRRERVAEHSVRDEDASAVEAGFAQEGAEATTADVGGHRDARASGAQPSRRLGDEEDIVIERAVDLAQDVDVAHALAGEASAHTLAERGEERARRGVQGRILHFAQHDRYRGLTG